MTNYVNMFLFVIIMLVFFPLYASAQTELSDTGKEIANVRSAVKEAEPGDYILLPSGKKYVLTAAEIAIVRGKFDYSALPGVKTETRVDGTEVKTISEAHTAYIYPDGQATHILKTDISFTTYWQQYLENKYYITQYLDRTGNYHDFAPIESARFKVFRASVQFQTISDGNEELESVTITAYNYQGKSFKMKYCSNPDMVWGYISGKGYSPVGDSHSFEFGLE